VPKNALFLLKNRKNWRALEAPPPDPLASGGWGLHPQTPIGLQRLGALPSNPATASLMTNLWLCVWPQLFLICS